MHRGLVHAVAWSLATGAAVTLSWWGVHTVMAGTAYDPPRALPLTADDDGSADRAEPLASSTRRPESPPAEKPPKPRGSTKTPHPPKSPEPSKSRIRSPDAAPPARSGTGTGTVKSYGTRGGRVVLDLGTESATLVSATPAAGWSVQTWKQDTWIRVEFTAGADKLSVFCTWHDTAPRVEINTY
ncbi:hypothetical protein [Streptomyces alboniger]|uniref:Secreted protein n=1 Tax=Streptomyces alboniger TaxID=132473 RepID=A0A5J6HDE2_STRAD|nr:hypothetical protein [Streptomyces alboniger]QEV18229.1 hypothetical protein CP975_12595 [Streptomyces alboniger]